MDVISQTFYDYYKGLTGTSWIRDLKVIGIGIIHLRIKIDLSPLDIPFSEDEVRGAVFDLAGDKSSGPDGLPTFFLQTFWEVIKDDLLWVLNDFRDNRADISRLNYALIMLIPKVNGANQVNQFRPISLLMYLLR